jgi:putative transcriptional regulator
VIAPGALLQHAAQMDLAGKLLIAMPGMGDPRFAHTVILVCASSDDGAMGLILNRPAPDDISFGGLLDQLGFPGAAQGRDIRVLIGGPMERGRGFVVHTDDYPGGQDTLRLGRGYGMTATRDVLAALAQGKGPHTALLALGYAGWGPGQLQAEIARNDWLTTEAPAELVFSTDLASKWTAALRQMGIDPINLSAQAGRA